MNGTDMHLETDLWYFSIKVQKKNLKRFQKNKHTERSFTKE